MDRLAAMRSFRAVVECGGFAAAGRLLGVSKATISKQVSALEDHLGAALIRRTTRRLSLTEAGLAFHADVLRILDDLADAEERVAGSQAELRGSLRLNAPLSFGVTRLMPVVAAYMARHPALRIDLALEDRHVEPVGHAFDLSLRIRMALDDSEMIARRIGRIDHVVCAARDYGGALPRAPDELTGHPMLVYGQDGAAFRDYCFTADAARRRSITVRITSALKTNSSLAIREALLAGAGVGVIPRFAVDRELADGRLVALLPGWQLPGHALFALFTGRQAMPAKVRLFLEMLVARREALTDG